MINEFGYYKDLYKRFGIRAILFLIASKFKTDKLNNRRIKELPHPLFLSNYGPDVKTLFQIFFAEEYKVPGSISPSFIIDCGANIGLSAVYYANKYPEAKVIAIEPDSNNFIYLQKNTANYKNVVCINKAVWSHTTMLEIVDIGAGNWSIQTRESNDDSQHLIETATIQQILQSYNIDDIDILKIDIEGAEKELFTNNYHSWLPKTKLIAIELHDNLDSEISGVFFRALNGMKYKKYFVGENLMCDFR